MNIKHISPLTHWVLASLPTVHDEDALTTLELIGRISAKLNEAAGIINQQTEYLQGETERLRDELGDLFTEELTAGTVSDYLNNTLLQALRVDLQELNTRIDNLVAVDGDSSSEVVDARINKAGKSFASLGQHVRDIEIGASFRDAVRPGTVKAGRLMAGMTGGELRNVYTIRETIPMAGRWNGNGYFDNNNNALVEHSGYALSDPIPCEYGDVFLLESYIYGGSAYPAAIYDADGKIIDVLGTPGNGTSWDMIPDEIHVDAGSARSIRFVCGTSQLTNFKCSRVTMKHSPDREVYGNGRGYIHARTMKRTDTVTDRAQVKMVFKLPEDHTADRLYDIPVQLLKYTNLSAWTFRLFGATTDHTYDVTLPESAAGYSYTTYQGLHPYFKVPTETTEGIKITHVALFVDLLPARDNEHINAYFLPVTMSWDGGSAAAEHYNLHGALTSTDRPTDTLSVVRPGAASSALHGKKIIGLGDSLMAGNTLTKPETWFNMMASDMDMEYLNAAKNGAPISGGSGSIWSIAAAVIDPLNPPDYVILQGGANDLRLNVHVATFKEDLTKTINLIRERAPKCKILLMTNWRRSEFVNTQGYTEEEYVVAMLEVAEDTGIRCVDNWTYGIDLTDPLNEWADEGLAYGDGVPNIHFSVEANRHIADKIRHELELI